MRFDKHCRAVLAIAAVAAAPVISTPASAQTRIHPSFYGSVEFDTREAQFYLLGMYVGMGKPGWSPYLNVNAYRLHYPLVGGGFRNLTAFSPTVGMAYAGRRGGVSFGAGYAFVDNEDPGAEGAEGGGSSGVTASFGAYHNGTGDRPLHTQFLSNYNFGSRYLWTRGRASVPFGSSTRHPARIGGEVVAQGGGKEGRTSNTFAVGPFLEYHWTPDFRTTGVVGYKSVGGSARSSRESAGYIKLEFSFSP